jgi:tetratricopeptide (TPR) repeat protein
MRPNEHTLKAEALQRLKVEALSQPTPSEQLILMKRVLKMQKDTLGGDDEETMDTCMQVCEILEAEGRGDEVDQLLASMIEEDSDEEELVRGAEAEMSATSIALASGTLAFVDSNSAAGITYTTNDGEPIISDLDFPPSPPQASVLKQAFQDFNKAKQLYAEGDFTQALALLNSIVTTQSKWLGDNHDQTLISRANVGLTLIAMRAPNNADGYSAQVREGLGVLLDVYLRRKANYEAPLIKGAAKEIGDESEDGERDGEGRYCTSKPAQAAALREALSNLASVQDQVGLTAEALKNYDSIIEEEEGLGLEPNLRIHNNAALILGRIGRGVESLSRHYGILAIQERTMGKDHPHTCVTLDTIGLMLSRNGDQVKAIEVLNKVVARRTMILGGGHNDTVKSMNNLALILARPDVNRLPEALTILNRIKANFDEQGMGNGLDGSGASHNVGAVLFQLGRIDEARPHFESAVAQRRSILGVKHPDTINSQYNLGRVSEGLGKFEDALQAYRSVYDSRCEIFGSEHGETLAAMGNIASALDHLNRVDESLMTFETILEVLIRVKGKDCKETITAMGNMAVPLTKAKKYKEAESILREAIVLSDKLASNRSPLSQVLRKSLREFEEGVARNSGNDVQRMLGNAPHMIPPEVSKQQARLRDIMDKRTKKKEAMAAGAGGADMKKELKNDEEVVGVVKDVDALMAEFGLSDEKVKGGKKNDGGGKKSKKKKK